MRWESSDGNMETSTALFGLSFQERQIIRMCRIMDIVVHWPFPGTWPLTRSRWEEFEASLSYIVRLYLK